MGYRIKAGKKTCILTHYPTVTANGMDTRTLNLYGHTHQTTNFYDNRPYMYHVGVDSHNCYPILLEDILNDIRKESK
jgi:calcineurin-like phosphoesterase family protein